MNHPVAPINLSAETVPEGWFLHEGQYLTNSARAARIPFRMVVRDPEKYYNGKISSHKVPVGIALREEDRPVWERALAKAGAAREAALKTPRVR